MSQAAADAKASRNATPSVMGRQFVAQVASAAASSIRHLLFQLFDLCDEPLDQLLLLIDGHIELIQQVFREAGFDFQALKTLLNTVKFVGLRHAGQSAWPKRATPSRILSASAVANDRRKVA